MNNVIEHTYTLYNNPFVLTQIILSFYKGYRGTENDILLSYLVLPLTLHQSSCDNIASSKVTSRIIKLTDNKDSMAGLSERIKEFKNITNLCIQHAVDNKLIEIDENMQVKVIGNLHATNPELQPSIKAANKLKNIFGSWDVVSIYKFIGIKQL